MWLCTECLCCDAETDGAIQGSSWGRHGLLKCRHQGEERQEGKARAAQLSQCSPGPCTHSMGPRQAIRSCTPTTPWRPCGGRQEAWRHSVGRAHGSPKGAARCGTATTGGTQGSGSQGEATQTQGTARSWVALQLPGNGAWTGACLAAGRGRDPCVRLTCVFPRGGHQLTNCLNCGKIICNMEAGKTCTFCTLPLDNVGPMSKKAIAIKRNEAQAAGDKCDCEVVRLRGGADSSLPLLLVRFAQAHGGLTFEELEEQKQSAARAAHEKALAHKVCVCVYARMVGVNDVADISHLRCWQNKLLRYDRTAAARTRVYDDQADYFADSSSSWLSGAERKRAEAADKRRQRDMHTRKEVRPSHRDCHGVVRMCVRGTHVPSFPCHGRPPSRLT